METTAPFSNSGQSNPSEPPVASEPEIISEPSDIVLVNDASALHENCEGIEKELRKQGHTIRIKCLNNERELLEYLDGLKERDTGIPDTFLLDVCGTGVRTARAVIRWFEHHRPALPLPAIHFCSLSVDMAIREAGQLQNDDERIVTGFVDSNELSWLKNYLSSNSMGSFLPVGSTFREILNAKLGTDLPLDYKEGGFADKIKKIRDVSNDRALDSWEKGKLSPEKALKQLRGYASGVAMALQSGLYSSGKGKNGAPQKDAVFYENAGFPVKGPVVFSLQEVEDRYQETGEKPVLVMQSYDPAVVPLLSSGKLGGLVVLSPYMASHLKFLCDSNMVSGLFGLIPPGRDKLSVNFNEEAKPDLAPWVEGNRIEIAGKELLKGDIIIAGLDGDGLIMDRSAVHKISVSSNDRPENNAGLRSDIKNLKKIRDCFTAFFREKGASPHAVKANIDSTDNALLQDVNSIGLVRTEQMVAGNAQQIAWMKSILLRDDLEAYESLFSATGIRSDYCSLFRRLDMETPVKIRLFDLTPRELLNEDEQQAFKSRYCGRLDIHGGEALKTWPRLYREQVKVIFAALNVNDVMKTYHGGVSGSHTPLEIMMPAVKTEEDVLAAKALIESEAEAAGIAPGRYRFGVMIETLDSCKNIETIARHCDFISYGTNDLTQEFFGISRSNLRAHAQFESKNGYNPFKKLAPEILELIRTTSAAAHRVKPDIGIDVCGAQAADIETAGLLFEAGIDNISVAPSYSNLYALPLLLNYRLYDSLQEQTKPAKNVEPPTIQPG